MMLTVTGSVCVLFGLVCVVGQLISVVNFPFAQKLGLQEKNETTDPLYRRLELNTARWDLVVLWTLPAAGLLMVLDHPWWPCLTLVAGGICVDTSGRETAKVLGLGGQGVKTGSEVDHASLPHSRTPHCEKKARAPVAPAPLQLNSAFGRGGILKEV